MPVSKNIIWYLIGVRARERQFPIIKRFGDAQWWACWRAHLLCTVESSAYIWCQCRGSMTVSCGEFGSCRPANVSWLWFDTLKSFLLIALTWERSSFLMSWFALGIARRNPITIPSSLCFENCPARCWKVTAGQDALWSPLVLWALSGIFSYKARLIHDSLSALWWWCFEHSRQLEAHVHPCSSRMATRFIETC